MVIRAMTNSEVSKDDSYQGAIKCQGSVVKKVFPEKVLHLSINEQVLLFKTSLFSKEEISERRQQKVNQYLPMFT